MDGVEGVCVDPGEIGAILGARGPGPPGGEKAGSWHLTVEEDRHSGMRQDSGGVLVTSHVYAQSECHCASYNNSHIQKP
jgi:hypothetical protein